MLFVVIVFEEDSTMTSTNSDLVNPGVCFMDEINIVETGLTSVASLGIPEGHLGQ